MLAEALLIDILWLLHEKQWSFTVSGKLERSPEHQGECCLANPVHFRAHSALQLWYGKELGRGHPGLLLFLQENKKHQRIKEQGRKNKAPSNKAGFHTACWVVSVCWASETHLNGSCSFFLWNTDSWFSLLKLLHRFPSVCLLMEGKCIHYLLLSRKSRLWTWFHVFEASLYVLYSSRLFY